MNKAVLVEFVDFIKLAIKEKNVETFKKDPKNSALLGGAVLILWILLSSIFGGSGTTVQSQKGTNTEVIESGFFSDNYRTAEQETGAPIPEQFDNDSKELDFPFGIFTYVDQIGERQYREFTKDNFITLFKLENGVRFSDGDNELTDLKTASFADYERTKLPNVSDAVTFTSKAGTQIVILKSTDKAGIESYWLSEMNHEKRWKVKHRIHYY